MRLWEKFKKEYNETEEYLKNVNTESDKQVVQDDEPENENWIWVEGFKGTNSEMKCHNDFQFEIGKEYSVKDVVLRESGFHFCLNLVDIDTYYTIDGENRFFKVKALVRESDYIKYGQYCYCKHNNYFTGVAIIDKLFAKTIVLTEEINLQSGYDDVFNKIIENHCSGDPVYLQEFVKELIGSLDDFYSFNKDSFKFVKDKCSSELIEKYGYSETFSIIIFRYDKHADEVYRKYNLAVALAEEGVSPDMRAYLLMK